MKWRIDTGARDYLGGANNPPLPAIKTITADRYELETLNIEDAMGGKYHTTYVHFYRGDIRVGTFPSFRSIMIADDEEEAAVAAQEAA